jgi:antitoxin component YwqK of YwqJK toxin-antitoxin module
MGRLFLIPVCAALLFFSCAGPAVNPDKADTGANAKHGISVNNPVDKTPHAVKDSIFNGEHIEKYKNGVIYMRGDIQGGLRAGEWLTFYPSGKPWSKGTYSNGLRQGYGVSYFENGNKSSEGYYKDDQMIGKWKFWDEYGNMKENDFGGQ